MSERLLKLYSERQRLLTEQQKIDYAFSRGAISEQERAYVLRNGYGGIPLGRQVERVDEKIRIFEKHLAPSDNHPARTIGIMAGLIILVLAVMLIGQYLDSPTSATGLVTLDMTPDGREFPLMITTSETIPLNQSNATSIRISGTLTGEGAIYAHIGDERLLVYEFAKPEISITTDMSAYRENDTINITVTPAGSAYTLWLTGPDGKVPVTEPVVAGTVGNYELEALVNVSGNISKVSTTYTVRDDASIPRTSEKTFMNACEETCLITTPGAISLEVVLTDTAKLTLNEVNVAEPISNSAPELLVAFAPVVIDVGEAYEDNLSAHFVDPDGDQLSFEINNMVGVDEAIVDDVLTVTGNVAGTYNARVYASDLQALTQADFTVTIIESLPMNDTGEENTTGPVEPITPIPIANITINTTMNTTTNTTDTITLNCTDPDPNKRDLGCIQQESLYFPDEAIYLEDTGRGIAARITSIGNFHIRGDVREQSSGAPDADEFIVYRYGSFGQATPVAWIDAATGDLHLTGRLYEEEVPLILKKGSYSIQNRQSINVAYFDRETGDLHLRGNLIPYRRSLE